MAGSARRFALPALLLGVFVLQSAVFARTQSLTTDEGPHLHAGLRAWRLGFLDHEIDSLPLPRLLLTLPLLAQGAEVDGAYPIRFVRPDPESVAVRARAVNTLLGVALGVLLWWTARRHVSEGGANLALAFYATSPGVVAHFSLATVDGTTALAIFALVVQLAFWHARPTRGRALALGAVAGVALAAKYSSLPAVALAVTAVALWRPDGLARRPRELQLRAALAVGLTAVLVLWATMFFHTARVEARGETLRVDFQGREEPLLAENPLPFDASFTLPVADYIGGAARLATHNREGHIAFFLGESSRDGWALYFPVAVLLKWPVVVLALLGVAAVLAWRRPEPLPTVLRLALACAGVLFGLAVLANINIGVRHVFPVYPLLLLLLATLWEPTRDRPRLRAALLGALALHVVDVARVAPDALGYFNPGVRPERAHRLLSDSNLDWGQGLLALRAWQRAHPGETLHLAYHGGVDPAIYGIQARPLAPGERVTGTVVVGSMLLSGHLLDEPDGFAWLAEEPRAALLNRSLHVYRVE